ncbi:hypothetical protein R1flu_009690 [Riccia fluitans]|uniref:Uncharacterized protein n=1 Tax=Riccia fluitans TaxID=41844 RepID=A0ABD1Z2V1_9MARC
MSISADPLDTPSCRCRPGGSGDGGASRGNLASVFSPARLCVRNPSAVVSSVDSPSPLPGSYECESGGPKYENQRVMSPVEVLAIGKVNGVARD